MQILVKIYRTVVILNIYSEISQKNVTFQYILYVIQYIYAVCFIWGIYFIPIIPKNSKKYIEQQILRFKKNGLGI